MPPQRFLLTKYIFHEYISFYFAFRYTRHSTYRTPPHCMGQNDSQEKADDTLDLSLYLSSHIRGLRNRLLPIPKHTRQEATYKFVPSTGYHLIQLFRTLFQKRQSGIPYKRIGQTIGVSLDFASNSSHYVFLAKD